MLNALQDFFQAKGYRGIGFSGGVAFYKPFDDELFVVQLVAQDTIALLDSEKLLKQRFDFEQMLRSRENIPVPIRFLTLVVIKDQPSDYFKKLAGEVRGFWMVSEARRNLIVYETQSDDYHGLYDNILDYINSGILEVRHKAEIDRVKSAIQPVTVGLIILNILVYLYALTHGDVMSANYMYSIGAITWDSIVIDHQYIRLITAAFLHYGIAHLSSNMLSLAGLGLMLEKRIGHIRFLLLYLISAVGANLVSVFVSYYKNVVLSYDAYAVSAGASGAVFGVVGGLIALAITQKKWSLKKADYVEINKNSIIMMAFFTLLAGFTTAGVDNAAHVGGMVFGFIIALIYAIKP